MGQGMAASVRDHETFWSVDLPPTAASVPAARHFATEARHALGEEGGDGRAELLVSELATNAVMHAHTPMRVSVWRHHGHMRFEVRDDDPTRPQEVKPDPMACGGRGMMLVDTMSLAWGVNGNEQGKTVWFELDET
jgi:anti-sigma regulatory factor (Ser/Thr protein kinase)